MRKNKKNYRKVYIFLSAFVLFVHSQSKHSPGARLVVVISFAIHLLNKLGGIFLTHSGLAGGTTIWSQDQLEMRIFLIVSGSKYMWALHWLINNYNLTYFCIFWIHLLSHTVDSMNGINKSILVCLIFDICRFYYHQWKSGSFLKLRSTIFSNIP